MISDVEAMARALELAERGRFTVSPNPLVGCVLVRDGAVVGEGWHERPGGPHAEVVALRNAGASAQGATAFVTLEPCNHTGRTPPCTDALIEAGISRVAAAVADPHQIAAGGGTRLAAAGVEVAFGLCADEAAVQNEVFLHGVRAGRPFVVAKAAVSLDGRIAAADGTSQWLTGEMARTAAHRLRAQVDAVVVGSGTVLADDPQLTVRLDDYDGAQPLRVVLDRRGRIGRDQRIFDDAAPTLVSTAEPGTLLSDLWDRDVRSVLVEGGATVLGAFLHAGLVDKLVLHIAPLILGPAGRPVVDDGAWPGTLAAVPRYRLHAADRYGDDVILTLYPGDV